MNASEEMIVSYETNETAGEQCDKCVRDVSTTEATSVVSDPQLPIKVYVCRFLMLLMFVSTFMPLH